MDPAAASSSLNSEIDFSTGDNALYDTRQWLNQPGGENVILLFVNMAQKEYTTLLDKHPDNARLLMRMACLEYRSIWLDKSKLKERVQKCAEWADKALSKPSGGVNMAPCLFQKGLALSKVPEWDGAIDSIRKAIAMLDTELPLKEEDVEVVHGASDTDKGRYREMLIGSLRDSLKLSGRFDEILTDLKENFKKEQKRELPATFDAKCAEWRQVHGEDRERASSGDWTIAALASALEAEENWALAEKFYRKALEPDSGYRTRHSPMGMMYPSEFFARLHEGLGRVCDKQGNWEDAKLHRRIGHKTHPEVAKQYFPKTEDPKG